MSPGHLFDLMRPSWLCRLRSNLCRSYSACLSIYCDAAESRLSITRLRWSQRSNISNSPAPRWIAGHSSPVVVCKCTDTFSGVLRQWFASVSPGNASRGCDAIILKSAIFTAFVLLEPSIVELRSPRRAMPPDLCLCYRVRP